MSRSGPLRGAQMSRSGPRRGVLDVTVWSVERCSDPPVWPSLAM